jgi:hypothetical protein
MLTEIELNALIAEVENEVVSLAKSEAVMQKYDNELPAEELEDEAMAEQAMADANPEMDAPEMEAPMDEAAAQEAAPEMDEMADDAVSEDMVDDAATDEMSEDLSMEDLVALYSEMDEQELELHYEAMRQALEKSWAKYDMEKQEMNKEECEEDDKDHHADKKEDKEDDEMEKSEKQEVQIETSQSEVDAKEQVRILEESLENLVKALDSKLPTRKAITEIVEDNSKPVDKPLSKDALLKKANDLTTQPLTKSERDVLNKFFVHGIGEDLVQDLVKAKKA